MGSKKINQETRNKLYTHDCKLACLLFFVFVFVFVFFFSSFLAIASLPKLGAHVMWVAGGITNKVHRESRAAFSTF